MRDTPAPAELVELPPTASNAIEEAFDQGWLMCARWASRDDLHCDMDSPAYQRERAELLAASLAAHGRVEVTALLQAVVSLQEYRPSAQKHPHAKNGMVGYMVPKAKTVEGEEYGWVKLSDVIYALTAALEKTP